MQFDPAAAVPNALKGKFIASLDVTETVSKSGNAMFKVELTINANGRDRKAWDYIGSWNLYKLKELANVCGLSDRFAAGILEDTDLHGQVVGVQVAPDKDDEDRISVKHYLSRDEVAGAPEMASVGAAEQPADPDIPF